MKPPLFYLIFLQKTIKLITKSFNTVLKKNTSFAEKEKKTIAVDAAGLFLHSVVNSMNT